MCVFLWGQNMQSKDWTNWCWYRLRLIWPKLSFKVWTTRSTLTSRCSSLDKSFRFSFKYSTTSAVSRDWLTDWGQRVSEELRSRFESSTFAGSRGSALRCYHLVRTKLTFHPSWVWIWVFTFGTNTFSNFRRKIRSQHLPGVGSQHTATISNLSERNPLHQN